MGGGSRIIQLIRLILQYKDSQLIQKKYFVLFFYIISIL